MKNGCFQIGEVSRITGISKDTLHFYSKVGLVVPDYIDPENQYRYYSRRNMWQLDIVTTCRKLSIPLEKVRQIMSSHDNSKIVGLLAEHQKEALRLSEYYQQVARDISWYEEENQKIIACRTANETKIERKWLAAEYVAVGSVSQNEEGYHANLQQAVKDILPQAATIQRRYGYIVDIQGMRSGQFLKRREYLKMDRQCYGRLSKEDIYELPEGDYAVYIAHIQNEKSDFSMLFHWLQENNAETDLVFAEELGLQLFDYIPDYYCEIKAHLKSS